MAVQIATATFTGVEASVDVTIPTPAGAYGISFGVETAGGAVIVVAPTPVIAGPNTVITVKPSAPFVGTVNLQIWDKT